MDKVRIGLIGYGNMGSSHAKNLVANKVPGGVLTAVFDTDSEKLQAARGLGEGVKVFDTLDSFFASKEMDAVIIATPHYDHPGLAIKCFENGLHVLSEKPAGVYTKQVRQMNDVAEKSGKIFCMMYNQRTNPLYQKVRDLIVSGELGAIKRTNWIITSWYRPQSYYDSGGWRATWAGEGGGVLLNQDPHQLDLWQWTCGMPTRVRAFMSFGKYHNIEVEDDVTAYVEYENGATGVFVTSTGDAPGTNRLEISGDRGKIVVEDDKLTFWRLRIPERQFNSEFKGGFGSPECWKCEVPITGTLTSHVGIMTNFVDAILNGKPLLASGADGILGLEISNAMHLSAWTDNWVNLPVDEELYYEMLQDKIKHSRFEKATTSNSVLDVNGTH